MSCNHSRHDDERDQLLVGKSLGDLGWAEAIELESSLTASERETLEEYERTVAALDLAMERQKGQELPNSLRASVLREASAFFDGQSSLEKTNRDNLVPPSSPLPSSSFPTGASWRRREVLAWLTSAAATTTAVGTWWWQRSKKNSFSDLELSRDQLLASANDLIKVEWKKGKTPLEQAVSGDVVWSSNYQKGFMRLNGMPINDPLREQYQLWIIDLLRDDEPVDGGVFDVGELGEVIVPIQAKLRVTKPSAFAITIEKPGGVVVSTQERLPLLAIVP